MKLRKYLFLWTLTGTSLGFSVTVNAQKITGNAREQVSPENVTIRTRMTESMHYNRKDEFFHYEKNYDGAEYITIYNTLTLEKKGSFRFVHPSLKDKNIVNFQWHRIGNKLLTLYHLMNDDKGIMELYGRVSEGMQDSTTEFQLLCRGPLLDRKNPNLFSFDIQSNYAGLSVVFLTGEGLLNCFVFDKNLKLKREDSHNLNLASDSSDIVHSSVDTFGNTYVMLYNKESASGKWVARIIKLNDKDNSLAQKEVPGFQCWRHGTYSRVFEGHEQIVIVNMEHGPYTNERLLGNVFNDIRTQRLAYYIINTRDLSLKAESYFNFKPDISQQIFNAVTTEKERKKPANHEQNQRAYHNFVSRQVFIDGNGNARVMYEQVFKREVRSMDQQTGKVTVYTYDDANTIVVVTMGKDSSFRIIPKKQSNGWDKHNGYVVLFDKNSKMCIIYNDHKSNVESVKEPFEEPVYDMSKSLVCSMFLQEDGTFVKKVAELGSEKIILNPKWCYRLSDNTVIVIAKERKSQARYLVRMQLVE